jgi:pectate lyase
VTIQWSILGGGNPDHNMVNLVSYNTYRVTLHHNLYINGGDRHPSCTRGAGASSLAPEIVCDVRNNLVWNYKWYGTAVRHYGKANVVNNYYYTPEGSSASSTIYVTEGGIAHVSGNFSKNGLDVNSNGNRSTPHEAVAIATTDAVTAAKQVVAQAGARGSKFGLDSVDQTFLGQISITN